MPTEEFKRKYSIVIITLAYLTLLFIAIYTVKYVEELSTHPMQYAAKKNDLQCSCSSGDGNRYTFNKSGVWVVPNDSPLFIIP